MSEADERAQTRAGLTLARTVADPLAVASENANLRSSIIGAHKLLKALVKREGGAVVIPFDEYEVANDPREELIVERDKDENVTLTIRRPNRADRRRAGR